MQIKRLENTLGSPSFGQIGRRLHLTGAGQEALEASRAIGRELNNLEHTLADLRGFKGGTLAVSVGSTASDFTARLTALFREAHPDVHVSLNVVNRETLLQHLADNSIGLALMGQPPEGHDLTAQPFMDNPPGTLEPGAPTYGAAPIRRERSINRSTTWGATRGASCAM